MIADISKIRLQTDENGLVELTLTLTQSCANMARKWLPDARKLIEGNKLLTADIGLKKKKRSLDANAYMWCLVNEIANVLRISKDECYLTMLKRYGQSQRIKVLKDGLPVLLKAVKYYELGKEENNCIYIKVYAGSSKYDTKEMSILIDGIVIEAEELGIDTMTPAEIEQIKQNWRG